MSLRAVVSLMIIVRPSVLLGPRIGKGGFNYPEIPES